MPDFDAVEDAEFTIKLAVQPIDFGAPALASAKERQWPRFVVKVSCQKRI
jgi:hypothetical protein